MRGEGESCLTYPNHRRQCVPQVYLELLSLPGEGPSIPQHKCEGHYARISVRSMEMVGHSLESMSWADAPDWYMW